MRAFGFTLLFIATAWAVSQPFRPIEHPPGVLVPEAPWQSEMDGVVRNHRMGEWTIRPLANYVVKARVLGTKRYTTDATADIAPHDLLLGWGPMSDSAILDSMEFRQSNRFGHWTFGADCPLAESEISLHAANTHLIPATDSVRDRIANLKVGSIVRLRGQLVEAQREDGGKPWRSSLKRTDRGDGACEIIYVESAIEL